MVWGVGPQLYPVGAGAAASPGDQYALPPQHPNPPARRTTNLPPSLPHPLPTPRDIPTGGFSVRKAWSIKVKEDAGCSQWQWREWSGWYELDVITRQHVLKMFSVAGGRKREGSGRQGPRGRDKDPVLARVLTRALLPNCECLAHPRVSSGMIVTEESIRGERDDGDTVNGELSDRAVWGVRPSPVTGQRPNTVSANLPSFSCNLSC